MAQLIDGKAIAAKVRAEVAVATARLKAAKGITPGLTVVRVGEDPASKTYVTGKRKAAAEVGFDGVEKHFEASVSHAQLLQEVSALNADPSVHGILVQLPLPKHVNADEIISAVDARKDADGFHPLNAGNLLLGRPGTRPCTPLGIMRMLQEIGYNP